VGRVAVSRRGGAAAAKSGESPALSRNGHAPDGDEPGRLPVRKVYYNLVVTGLSVAAAFLIGTVEVLGILTSELNLHGAFWDFMANFDLNKAGFTIAGLFLVVWAVAIAVWRFGGLESRWDRALPPAPPR